MRDNVNVGVAGQAQAAAAQVDLRAPVAGDPQVVAAYDRIVEPDLGPVVRAVLGREMDRAAEIGDATDARGQIVVRAARRRRGSGERARQHDGELALRAAARLKRCNIGTLAAIVVP